MTPSLGRRPVLVFDAMCLNHFARAERLDVLGSLLTGDSCHTTQVVRGELRQGLAHHAVFQRALELDWLEVFDSATIPNMGCFAQWVKRIGAADRNVGEASVFAAAEILDGIAITDDQAAVRVARANGIEVHGTVWLLARACREGKLTEVNAENLVDMLRDEGMWLPCSGAGLGDFRSSAWTAVTEAVARQREIDLLAELAALLERERGPIPEEFLAEAEAAWPDKEILPSSQVE